MTDIIFENSTGKDFFKEPGTINGEAITLSNLDNCNVYLLDYSGGVECTNVKNSQIFIGPVDGFAIFNKVEGCQIAVACQQLQVKNSSDVEFGLYCATKPTIESSKDIRFTCWMGAYPGLTQHFSKANLDPKANQWDKVHDISAEEGEPSNFELLEGVDYWEVPIEGGPPCDNPVPAFNGTLYNGGAGTAVAGGGAAPGGTSPAAAAPGLAAPAPEDLFRENGGDYLGGPVENGGHPAGMAGAFGEEHPKVAAVRASARERLQKQEEAEARAKESLVKQAAGYLETFYQKRNAVKGKRTQENRTAEKQITVDGPQGDTEWEKTISLINFGFPRPNGSDLSRFKAVLFAAKTKNVPLAGKAPPSTANA